MRHDQGVTQGESLVQRDQNSTEQATCWYEQKLHRKRKKGTDSNYFSVVTILVVLTLTHSYTSCKETRAAQHRPTSDTLHTRSLSY